MLSNFCILIVSVLFFVIALFEATRNSVPFIVYISIIADNVRENIDENVSKDTYAHAMTIDFLTMLSSAMGITLAIMGMQLKKK